MQYPSVQCSAVQCSAVQCSSVQCSAVSLRRVGCGPLSLNMVMRANIQLVISKVSGACTALHCTHYKVSTACSVLHSL
jgi:hypothetical protein